MHFSQTNKNMPAYKKKKSVIVMCLEFHINTPLKICSNCVWFLSSSSRGYITTSKHVYCLKINSVDRKPLWDKHDPYVLVLHFRRISILMWLCLHTVQFDYSFLCFLRQNRNRMNRKCVLSTRLLNSINDWLACLDKQGTFFFLSSRAWMIQMSLSSH